MDALLKKTGMDNKYELVRLVMKRVRQLVNDKNRMSLINSNQKFISLALGEISEGKLKIDGSVEKE